MDTTTATVTPIATLVIHAAKPGHDQFEVTTADGTYLGRVKDGGHIVRNVDKLAKGYGLHRSSGYALDAERRLVATAVDLSA